MIGRPYFAIDIRFRTAASRSSDEVAPAPTLFGPVQSSAWSARPKRRSFR